MRPDYYKVMVRARVPGHAEFVEVEVECFDLIRALRFDFFLGNALKYLFRLGRKPGDRRTDLAKVRTYCHQVMQEDERRERAAADERKRKGEV